jgi:hypothetical protein
MVLTADAVSPDVAASAYAYPTVRRTGLDVLLIGLTPIPASLAGAASGDYPINPGVFFPGFIISITAFLALKRRLTIGHVQSWQEQVIRGAMPLEGLLILFVWLAVRDIRARQFCVLCWRSRCTSCRLSKPQGR